MRQMSYSEMEKTFSGGSALTTAGCIIGVAGLVGGFVGLCVFTGGAAGALFLCVEHVVSVVSAGLSCGYLFVE